MHQIRLKFNLEVFNFKRFSCEADSVFVKVDRLIVSLNEVALRSIGYIAEKSDGCFGCSAGLFNHTNNIGVFFLPLFNSFKSDVVTVKSNERAFLLPCRSAFNSNGNKGIACGLNNLQKISDGEPLGGKSRAEDDFASDDDDEFLD